MDSWLGKNAHYQQFHVAIIDNNEQKFIEGLLEGTKLLHKLRKEQKYKIFIHDETGITKATTLILLYLVLVDYKTK